MNAEQISENEMSALLDNDHLLPDYGEIPYKEIISIMLNSIPLYLKEGFSKFSDTKIGLSHLQVTVKEEEELSKEDIDGGKQFIIYRQAIKDPKFQGHIVFITTEESSLKLGKAFLDVVEPSLNKRALEDLQRAFNRLSNGMFSMIENDYKKAISLDNMMYEETEDITQALTAKSAYIELSFQMSVGSIICPVILLMPVPFGGSLAKLLSQEIVSNDNTKTVRPIQFSSLEAAKTFGVEQHKVDILLDVAMELTAELGRTRIKIRDVLSLGEGSIIELQKLAGEAIDILVNGKTIAKGEVVVIDEYFGLRVTEIEQSSLTNMLPLI